jgi:hypothetical protein
VVIASDCLEVIQSIGRENLGRFSSVLHAGPVLGILGPGAKLEFKALAIKLGEFLLGHVRMKARRNPYR